MTPAPFEARYLPVLASYRRGLHETFAEAKARGDLPEMRRINRDLLRLSKYQLSLIDGSIKYEHRPD